MKVLLQPTVRQRARLECLLAAQCDLYNAGLQERRGAWRWEQRSVTRFEQYKTLTGMVWEGSEFGVTVARGTLLRLDRAFQAFYRRCRTGDKPGFPRFKAKTRWDSVEYPDTSGWKVEVDARRVYVQGVGHVRARFQKRGLPGTPKTVTIRREGRRWFAVVFCVDVPAQPMAPTGQVVGVDRGISVLAALSDGTLVDNPRPARRAAARLALEQQRLARCRRGSNRRRRQVERVAAAHRKIRQQRTDSVHQLSRRLVDSYDVIVVEDLKIANMTRRPAPRPSGDGGFEANGAAAKAGLNKAILDAGWGDLLCKIVYKAESAGRRVELVDPRNTSRTCHQCGHVDPANRSGVMFACVACGHRDHADVNAAKNILRLGRSQRASVKPGTAA